MKTLAQQWQEFERKVVPEGACAGQRADMEDSFYAGAFVMLGTMSEAAASSATDEIGMTRIAKLHLECNAYFRMAIARQTAANMDKVRPS